MNDVEVKLNSNNPIFVAQAISKIVDTIITKHQSRRYDRNYSLQSLPEYNYLEQICVHDDANINLTACKGILTLAEKDVIPRSGLENYLRLIAIKEPRKQAQ